MNVNMGFFDYKAYGRDMTINETGQLVCKIEKPENQMVCGMDQRVCC